MNIPETIAVDGGFCPRLNPKLAGRDPILGLLALIYSQGAWFEYHERNLLDGDDLCPYALSADGEPWYSHLSPRQKLAAAMRNWAILYRTHDHSGRNDDAPFTMFEEAIHGSIVDAVIPSIADMVSEELADDSSEKYFSVRVAAFYLADAKTYGGHDGDESQGPSVEDMFSWLTNMAETLVWDQDWVLFKPTEPPRFDSENIEYFNSVTLTPCDVFEEVCKNLITRKARDLVGAHINGRVETVTAPKDTGYIYAIRSSGGIKIGMTKKSPSARLKDLQTAHHEKLELVGSVSVQDTRCAELSLHVKFHERRLSGEWFSITADEALAALQQLQSA